MVRTEECIYVAVREDYLDGSDERMYLDGRKEEDI